MMEKRIIIVVTAAFMAIVAAGCLKGSSYLDRMAALEKDSCACMDKACAEKAFNDFLAIARDIKKENASFGDEDTKKLGMSTSAIFKCVMMKGVSPVLIMDELQKMKK